VTASAATHPAGAATAGDAPGQPPGTGSHAAIAARAAGSEACPLCGAPLAPEQEWCLNCGAAARTRLAATPNWKAPIVSLAVIAVLALGVLAAALVKLAGGSSSSTPPITRTVTTAPTASTPAATSTATPGVSTPGAAVPGTSTPSTGAVTPGNGTSTTTPGASTAPAGGGTATANLPTISGARVGGAKGIPSLTPAELERIRQLRNSTAP